MQKGNKKKMEDEGKTGKESSVDGMTEGKKS